MRELTQNEIALTSGANIGSDEYLGLFTVGFMTFVVGTIYGNVKIGATAGLGVILGVGYLAIQS